MQNQLERFRKNNHGLTLAEIVIALTLVGIVSVFFLLRSFQDAENSRIGVDEAYISSLGRNLQTVAVTDLRFSGNRLEVTIGGSGVFAVTEDSYRAEELQKEMEKFYQPYEQRFQSGYYRRLKEEVRLVVSANGELKITGTKNPL